MARSREWWAKVHAGNLKSKPIKWIAENWHSLTWGISGASLAGFVLAAAALGVPINTSCAAIASDTGAGAMSLNYVWGLIDNTPHAIFQADGLVYAIDAKDLGDTGDGVLTNAIPSNAIPNNAIPSNLLKAGDIPLSAIPFNGIPSNAIPSNIVRAWDVANAMQQIPAGGFLEIPLIGSDGSAILHYTFGLTDHGVDVVAGFNSITRAIPAEAIPSKVADLAIPSNINPTKAEKDAILRAWASLAIPSNAIPSNAIPAEAIPSNFMAYALPASALPSSALPSSALPSNALPSSALPASALPSSLTTKYALLPAYSIPSNAIPSNAIPSNLLPTAFLNVRQFGAESLFVSSLGLKAGLQGGISVQTGQFVEVATGFKSQEGFNPDTDIMGPIDAGSFESSNLLPTSDKDLKSRMERDHRLLSALNTADVAIDKCRSENENKFGHNWEPLVRATISRDGVICRSDQILSATGTSCIDYITATVTDADDFDGDDDGYTPAQGDCRDDLVAVNPDAEEVRGDGLDNNCDGEVDEGTPGQEVGGVAGDSDGDGWLNEEDCKPSDRHIYPGADEIYGDGVDNDCDGEIDEGFLFGPGSEIMPGDPPASDPDPPPPASDPDPPPPASDPDPPPPAPDPDPPPPTETVSLSVEVFGPSAINSSMIVGGSEACSGPFSTDIDMWVDRRVNGSPVPTGLGDVQSASMTWSGVTSGSSGMWYIQQDVWSAQLGPFENVGGGSIVVTGWITTSSGIQRSGTTSVSISNCMQEIG